MENWLYWARGRQGGVWQPHQATVIGYSNNWMEWTDCRLHFADLGFRCEGGKNLEKLEDTKTRYQIT